MALIKHRRNDWMEARESLRDVVVKTRDLSSANYRRAAARIDEEDAEKNAFRKCDRK